MVQWINLSRYNRSVVDSRLKPLVVTKNWAYPSSTRTSESYDRQECVNFLKSHRLWIFTLLNISAMLVLPVHFCWVFFLC